MFDSSGNVSDIRDYRDLDPKGLLLGFDQQQSVVVQKWIDSYDHIFRIASGIAVDRDGYKRSSPIVDITVNIDYPDGVFTCGFFENADEVKVVEGEPDPNDPSDPYFPIYKFTHNADGSKVVEDLRTFVGETPSYSNIIPLSINENVTDYWSYIYSEYTFEMDRGGLTELPAGGTKIRLRLTMDMTYMDLTSCSIAVGGVPVSMGCTLYGVNFSFNSFAAKEADSFGTLHIKKRLVQDLVDFETVINAEETAQLRRNMRKIYDDIVLFIVDEQDDSKYENMMTLGVIENASAVVSNPINTTLTWSIMESV
jgi:hypothetical protein